jgi:predicted PurR-regulated permease PerM
MEESTQQNRFYTITVKPETIRKVVLWGFIGLGLLGIIAVLPALKSVITTVILALFLAFLLEPVVNFIENRGLNRLLATIIVFLFILTGATLALKFGAPTVVKEVQHLSSGMHESQTGSLSTDISNKLAEAIPLMANPMIQEEVRTKIDNLLRKSFTMVFDIISTAVSIVMLAFILFFFLIEGRRMKKAVVSWVPNRYFEMTLILLHKTSTQLGKYIRGQLIVASIVGALSIFALYQLEIRYFFFIGALAGLANMIPYFGPIVGAIPAVIIALIDTGSFGVVAVIAVAFAAIQLFENVFVSPFVVAKSVELHPLTIIIVVMIGGKLMGIVGMLLAVPTASIIKVTAQEVAWGIKNYRVF